MQPNIRSLYIVAALALLPIQLRAGAPLIQDADLSNAGMYSYWTADLPLAKGDALEAGYLVDEALYVVSRGGTVYALDAQVGLIRWANKLTEADYNIYRPTHIQNDDDNGPVVFSTITKVVLYDRYNGDVIQSFKPNFPVGGTAVGADNGLFLGSSNSRFYGLLRTSALSSKPYQVWDVLAGGAVLAAPILYDFDLLIFASQGGQVFSCRAGDKKLIWSFQTRGPILGDPVKDDDSVYVASGDRSVYKLGLLRGGLIWRFRMQQPLTVGPQLLSGVVFQHSNRDGLVALDAKTGKEKWRLAEGRSVAAHTKNGDLIAATNRRLLVVDHQKGDILHTLPMPDAIVTVANSRTDSLFVLGGDGRVLCARLDDVPYLRRQRVLAARAALTRPPSSAGKRATTKPKPSTKSDPRLDDPLRSKWDKP